MSSNFILNSEERNFCFNWIHEKMVNILRIIFISYFLLLIRPVKNV